MKISLNWIKDYVAYGLSTEKLVHKLTMAGLEVEAVTQEGGDTVLELEITPNRADCLSFIGMAREIAAVTKKKLKVPAGGKTPAVKRTYPIAIENPKDCRQYLGTVIEGAQMKAAPAAVQKKLAAIGLRPISNMVDATNFCLMEQGQPLHAFDLDKLEGGKITVRRAKKGEKIVTIDGEERTLDPTILVIADAKRPVAIAGIMGGKDTEVGPGTKNILLESAYFDPILIRRASRKLGLSSDSSYRFERGVDFDGVLRASNRAVQLILEWAGGKVTRCGRAGAVKNPFRPKAVGLNAEHVNASLGTKLSSTQIKTILQSLAFRITGQGKKLKVLPPAFRSDIHAEVDLIEEVARMIGYDQLPTGMPAVPACDIPVSSQKARRDHLRELLLAQGLNEAITFSLISREDLEKCGCADLKALGIVNPLSLDQAVMRPSLLPSLLAVARGNVNRGNKDVHLFELGKIYDAAAREEETLGLVLAGQKKYDWRRGSVPVDIFDVKGVLEQVFHRLNTGAVHVRQEKTAFFDAAQSGAVYLGQKKIGTMGKLHPDVLKRWEIKDKDVFYAEVKLPEVKAVQKRKFRPLSDYPAIVQDVSLAVKENVSFENITDIALNSGCSFLKEVRFHELYMGEKIPAGQRGLMFSLVYQSDRKTLREEEVLKEHEKIVAAILKQLDAVRR